jgi:chemotaxis protein CheZ
MNFALSVRALQPAPKPNAVSDMPIQRKIFRVEQMAAAGHHEATNQRAAVTIAPDGLRRLQHEADVIHRAIVQTKQEIAALHANAFGDGQPRAARELGAVVDGTERAAHQILDAAEVIAKAAKSLATSCTQAQEQALTQDIRDNVLRIFEACNFRDLSGQRITKVLAMLQFIEERIARMMEIWGGADAFRNYAAPSEGGREPGLLHGLKLTGDRGHVSQDDIDAILRDG